MTFFSEEDFEKMDRWSPGGLAWMCNQKLQRDAQIVYGIQNAAVSDMYFSLSKDDEDTHRALLICVEEIVLKICEHDAQLVNVLPGVVRWECLYCKKTMKPTKWEVADD